MPPDNEDLDEVLKMVSVLLRDGNFPSSTMADQITSEDENDSGHEFQKKSTSHEHVTVETLPNEIISSIAGMLAVSIDVPYVVSRPDLKTSNERKSQDANARRDLRSLCMVSRRMASNAKKVLYRNVLITHTNTLILLYRTFLENPNLGIYVKRMILNVDHGWWSPWHIRHYWGPQRGFVNPIDLSPLLSTCCSYHGLGEHFPEAVRDSRCAPGKIPVEMLFNLQFRVLSHTSNIESLDVNIQPNLPLIRTYTNQDMEERHWEEVGAVLCSLWEEVLPCLSGIKNLQIFAYYQPPEYEDYGPPEVEDFPLARQLFHAQICRCFLKLPKLEKLVWVNFSNGWCSTLPFLTVSGIDTESRFESVRVLQLEESPCLPQGLGTICSAFPNLESLSVANGSRHKNFEPSMPYRLDANQDLATDTGDRSLTDSLTALKDLKTLRLDLGYSHEISGTLGPSGTLSLAGLPNLETVEVPFHFFARSVLPEGYHEVAFSERSLPRSLKSLRIMACWYCDEFEPPLLGYELASTGYHNPDSSPSPSPSPSPRFTGPDRRYWTPPGRHGDAVFTFLERLASFHDEYFPSLEYVCYEEVEPSHDIDYDYCWGCRGKVHLKSTFAGTEHLHDVEELLHDKGVLFENLSKQFLCLGP